MKRIFICDGRIDVSKYEWNLLSFGETRNMKFNIDFLKLMLSNALFCGLLCLRMMQKQCSNKCVWYPKAWCRTADFCNKFQVKLFLLQWFGPVFLSSSSPKAGICSKRSNLHISSFLKFAPVLWIIDKHCNKIIEPATNKYVGHTQAIY